MADPPDIDTLADLLADECARQILVETRGEALPAAALSERTGASEPTVYRRLERLQAADLVAEEVQVVTDGKNYSVYRARLDGVELDLTDDGFEVEIARRERMADRFTRLVEEM
ncbi:winged helix-turn-helix domain-containing protein [Haloarchaeobius iranensis]|uniref:winged helix-turn-helix domain-containing protein n=1 Tax=Haloarchaeobius iranensis TaxID=996166 RepID=UPI001FE1DE29|nr:winged helix-turn-helix domain-containing protein [Haloarchaeobius iranensis]